MKKIITSLLVLALLFGVIGVFAMGDVIGHIYSTDILTFVNGKPACGYNIGGRTVVIAEELDGYGFNVEYNDEIRTLKIESYFDKGHKVVEEIPRGRTGEIMGNVYTTDIKVYYNGILLRGYNIGGRTAVCLEDLGDLTDSPNARCGYSQYLGKSIWNPDDRTICFESYIKNQNEILGISRVYHTFKDNVIYTQADDFCARSEFLPKSDGGIYTYSPGTGAARYNIKPLYFDNHGTLVQVGLCVANPNNTQNEALMYIEDTEKVKEMVKTFKNAQKSHNEAVEHFEKECVVREKIENENYTVLLAEHKTEGILFVYINKNGGFVTDSFFSGYGDREIKFWFDEEAEDTVIHTVSPFAGPHGATTMQYATELDTYDYE